MPPKTRFTKQDRNEGGKFLKRCGSVLHETSNDGSPLFNIPVCKKIKNSTMKLLMEKEIICNRTKFICHACIDDLENSSPVDSSKATGASCIVNLENISDDSCKVNESPESQVEQSTSRESLMSECIHIGSMLDTLIKSDISALYNEQNKSSIDKLLSYNPDKWLAHRPPELVNLIKLLFGNPVNEGDTSFKVAKAVEYIYGCRNSKLVLPLSFQENILIYSLSRSKNLVSYFSKLNPSGSYDYMSKWMLDQASSPIEVPTGIVRSVFDNEQVIGKTYKVRAENKVPMSIVTSHIYISIDPNNKIQNEEQYSPNNWLFKDPTEIQKHKFMCEEQKDVDFFRKSRNAFIKERLSFVNADQCQNNEVYSDFIDKVIFRKEESQKEKTCISCGAENEIKSRKCTNCRGNLILEKPELEDLIPNEVKIHPYKHFAGIKTEENQYKVKTGEPDMLNPNSFESISEILFNMGQRAGLEQYNGNDRKWLFIECDGGIYTVVDKLIFNVLHCTRCKESIYGHDAFLEHRCSMLHDSVSTHEFGWVLPMPGLLHIEMNACKAFFEINWEIVLKDICMKLGFVSPKALDYAKRCGDHHKTWSILEIMYIAVADELLVPFVRHCKEAGIDISVQNYWVWSDTVENSNYCYMQQMVFTFLHAIMLFRTGCRKGNPDAIIAGRNKLSLLLYARNHPRYQRILAVNRYIESMMPEEVMQILQSSFTLSRIGHVGHYQGGDACLEEINKDAKAWIKQIGVPSEKEWLKVFRNLDRMNEVKKNLIDMVDGKPKNQDQTQTEREQSKYLRYEEVIPVRALLRANQYLMHVTENKEHRSVDGQIILNPDLANFNAIAEGLKNKYMQSFLDGNDDYISKSVIYVTSDEMEENNKIENMTKKEIQRQIFMILEEMPENEAKLLEEVFNKTIKTKTKDAFISFYYSLFEN